MRLRIDENTNMTDVANFLEEVNKNRKEIIFQAEENKAWLVIDYE